MDSGLKICSFFFFNDTATTEIYTLSLHDALPIWRTSRFSRPTSRQIMSSSTPGCRTRSEEHTSELQSHLNLVCRLLLEKKKNREDLTLCLVSTSRVTDHLPTE